MKLQLKKVTPKYNAQPQLVCPNSSHYLNRHLSAQFGDLVNPHLKITNGRLANFQNSLNLLKEIHHVLKIVSEILMGKTCRHLKLK